MQEQKLSKWILVISSFLALLGFIVSASLIFSPESVLKTVDLSAKGASYLTYMWAARQFAVGFVFAFTTFKKSAQMLTLAYVFFLVMNIGDFFVGISQHDSSLYIGAFVMCILSSVMLYFINRKTK